LVSAIVAATIFAALWAGRLTRNLLVILTFSGICALGAFGISAGLGASALAGTIGAEALVLAVLIARARRPAAGWRREFSRAKVLAPPFEGIWVVAAGGPIPAQNHHLVASDQRFAYDFVRLGKPSLGSSVLSPAGGTIAFVRDGMEDLQRSLGFARLGGPENALGNHVVLEVEGWYVFLCHLQRGSICVEAGQTVAAGQAVGKCGNSGRTTAPHLHVHAQDRSHYAFREARGLPVTFGKTRGEPRVLRKGSFVNGDRRTVAR